MKTLGSKTDAADRALPLGDSRNPDTPAHSVSVLVLTYNEEKCIQSCLDSVVWSNDIVVLDSFSSDRTVEILKEYRCVRIFQRRFDNFSSQRNYGLHNVQFRNEWVLIIDADERCSPALKEEVLRKTSLENSGIDAYCLRRNIFFLGTFLKHNSFRVVWLERVVKPLKVQFSGSIHEKPSYTGKSAWLDGTLSHYPFIKGVDHWVQRRNIYSSLAAQSELLGKPVFTAGRLFSGNPVHRREALNALYRRLPFRWVWFFFYNLVAEGCFLDGWKGIYLALLESYYEFLIVLKVREERLIQVAGKRN